MEIWKKSMTQQGMEDEKKRIKDTQENEKRQDEQEEYIKKRKKYI